MKGEGREKGGERGRGALARVRRENVNCTLQGGITGCTELISDLTLISQNSP